MTLALLLTIRFHEPRYHGSGAWPPAPMRLFQALVAGAAQGARLPDEDRAALEWLERLSPPEIVAPPVTSGHRYINYVPNNDADAGKDPTQAPKAAKTILPHLFETNVPVYYLWTPVEDCLELRQLCQLAERLHHLGRGVDAAWCEAQLLPEDATRATVAGQGVHHRPSGNSGTMQAVPVHGSLRSLERRFALNRRKFRKLGGKGAFSQPPKPLLREISYDAPPDRVLYEILDGRQRFVQVSPRNALTLTSTLLNGARARLAREFADRTETFDRLIIGRGADADDKLLRIRLIPLPSIGSEHVDRNIRRVLLEIPQDCPIRRDTVLWAFDGLAWHDADGVVLGSLVCTDDEQMLSNYKRERKSLVWQTEIPAALGTGRRWLGKGDTKPGTERLTEEGKAISAVHQALRHAGIDVQPTGIEVQREPFSARGTLCNDVESGRFDKHVLWHVRLRFERPLSGPLVIGNGRYTGLGVMSPVEEVPDIFAFRIDGGLQEGADAESLAQALRRAVMARVQAHLGPRVALPGWFTGHQANGAPLQGGGHAHLTCIADLPRERLLVIPPHPFDSTTKRDMRHLEILAGAMLDFTELRAGSAGALTLCTQPVGTEDPLLRHARIWQSVTPYAATRHPRRESAEDALVADVQRELGRRGLPSAEVEVLEIIEATRKPVARLRLTFATAQVGPILLGRTLHKGGGVFEIVTERDGRPT